MENLRIGLPSKGRLAEEAAGLMKEAGFKFRRQDRSLLQTSKANPLKSFFCVLQTF